MGPIEIGLLLVGLLLGPFINFSIYYFAYFPRPISPWQLQPESISKRNGNAKIPIVGWLFRREECVHFGPLFWLRPFLIELATPIAIVFLYGYCKVGTFSPGAVGLGTLRQQFVGYALLIALMTVATFIDFDERTIPDFITIPGTIFGLVGALIFPDWRLIELVAIPPALVGIPIPLQANSPDPWNATWNGGFGLFLGLLFWSLWCFGMADRRWITRRGMKKAVDYFFEVLRRNPSTRLLFGLWIAGVFAVTAAYMVVGPMRWEALLSSLFGIGLGGALVWGFRIVAQWAMGQEALGFGDVTLMAMIGAFFGWQIVWIAFFLAPFFGLIFVVIAWIVTRDNATPFGPYLCAATLYCMLDWVNTWGWCSSWFLPPHLLFPIFLGLLIALGAMLWLIQTIKFLLFGHLR